MIRYQEFFDQKIKEIAEADYILDVGGGRRFQKWLAPYKKYFCEENYRTMDYDRRYEPDIIGDIHNIPIEDNKVGGIICLSVLEHVADPHKAVSEMRRILRDGGKIFVYVPSTYPYHAKKGSYTDCWRFFDDTLDMLFKQFKNVEIVKRGGYFKAMSFFLPLQHKLQFALDPLANLLDKIFNTKRRTTTSGYYIYAEK